MKFVVKNKLGCLLFVAKFWENDDLTNQMRVLLGSMDATQYKNKQKKKKKLAK